MERKYDFYRTIEPGMIVNANVTNFDGTKKSAIFLVLYDEQADDDVYGNNCIGVKLTSRDNHNYIIKVDRTKNNFLDKDCVICCSKLWTLTKDKHIYNILGKVDKDTLNSVYYMYKKFNIALDKQVKKELYV